MTLYRVGIAAILEVEASGPEAVEAMMTDLAVDAQIGRRWGGTKNEPWPGVESVCFFMVDQDGEIAEVEADS